MAVKKKQVQNVFAIALFIAIGMVLLGLCIFFYFQYQHSQALLNDPTLAAREEVASVVAILKKSIELPNNETPTVATVADVNKVKLQPFFFAAQNGDKVIIYPVSRKIILYRPSTTKVINISSMNSISDQSTIPVQPTTFVTQAVKPPMVKAVILNGSKINGLAGTVETKLMNKYATIQVVEKGNASKEYTETTVVDVSGNNTDLVKDIATFIGGSVGQLPAGEKMPNAEILVIAVK